MLLLTDGATPSLTGGVSAAEVRTLIGAGTSSLTLGTSSTTALAGNTSLFDGAYSSLTGVPSTFSPSSHSHDDLYYTETESDSRFTRKYTFSPGSANQGRRYIRLFTLDDFDDGVTGILSAAGDYGDADKAMYHIQIGTRTSLSFDVYQTSDAAVADDYNFYYRQIANDDYEIWALMSTIIKITTSLFYLNLVR